VEAGACYHIWSIAEGGNAAFRIRRCFKTKSTADTTARRGVVGDRGSQRIERHTKHIVAKCYPGCPCGNGRKEHNNERRVDNN